MFLLSKYLTDDPFGETRDDTLNVFTHSVPKLESAYTLDQSPIPVVYLLLVTSFFAHLRALSAPILRRLSTSRLLLLRSSRNLDP